MMEYPKINSLWKRQGWYFDEKKKKDPAYKQKKHSFIVGDYACEEFGLIKEWDVYEKVDGTNIRVMFDGEKVKFGGRTADAHIPCHLLDVLQELFTDEKMKKNFSSAPVILFGEGYGSKIQKVGSSYRSDPGFILFDVKIGDWWLNKEGVFEVANQMGIPMVPYLGSLPEKEIVDLVKSKPKSECSQTHQIMEGVVCKTSPLLFNREGNPVMFKLKCKEF